MKKSKKLYTRKKTYGILGKHKTTGEYIGYTELSFSMSFENNRIATWYNHGKNKTFFSSMQETCIKFNKKYTDIDFFIVNLHSKKCPIKADFKTKAGKSNLYFKVKE